MRRTLPFLRTPRRAPPDDLLRVRPSCLMDVTVAGLAPDEPRPDGEKVIKAQTRRRGSRARRQPLDPSGSSTSSRGRAP
jgi:hypothetical protein